MSGKKFLGFAFHVDEPKPHRSFWDETVVSMLRAILRFKYIHVEIYLEDGYCYSITRGRAVHKIQKKMNEHYEFLLIEVTEQQYDAVRSFLERKFEDQCGFHYLGFYFNFIQPCIHFRGNGEKFFC